MPPALGLPRPSLLAPVRKARAFARRVATRARDYWRGETDGTLFDLHDLPRLNAVLVGRDVPPVTADPGQAADGVAGACRFVLGLLASSPSLRRRFPRALSDGPAGPFASWLAGEGRWQFGVPAVGIPNIRAAFEQRPGLRVRRVYELREDLRETFPLGLTPRHRGEYLGWLVSRYGRADFDLTAEEVLWYFFELDEDPSRGLTTTYRWQPSWQAAVPHGLTRFGWNEFKRWVSARYRFTCRWLRSAALPSQFSPWDELQALLTASPGLSESFPRGGDANAIVRWARTAPGVREYADRAWLDQLAVAVRTGEATRPGVNILSHARFPSGLQVEAEHIAARFRSSGFQLARRDIPVNGLAGDWSDPASYHDPELFPVSFVKIGASEPFDEVHRRAGLHRQPGVYRIAGWSWELEAFPREYAERAGSADEFWVPSEFCASAVRKVITDRPVFAMPPGVSPPVGSRFGRRDLGVPEEVFLVLFLFDMNSSMERKNPLGLIRAFRRAFRPDHPALLLIKVSRGDSRPDDLRRLCATAGGGQIRVVDRMMPRPDVFGLMAACDCYASLHRAEGFGLTVAEAMLLGKPVVSTNYSATTEFLTADTGLPVGYRLVPVGEEYQPGVRDAAWADPDERDAADRLRWVFEHRAEARALGERARRHAEAALCPAAAARRMADRVREILATRGSPRACRPSSAPGP